MVETIIYHQPTPEQLTILHKEPEAREIFQTLSPQVQLYLHLNWQKGNPDLSKEERKSLSARTAVMALDMFGEKNIDKGYNREIQKYTDAVWQEVWEENEA